MFKGLLKGKSETSRLIRRYRSGSLPIMAPAGTLRLTEVVGQATWPAVNFMFVFFCLVNKWRFNSEFLWNCITAVGVIMLMIWPATAVFVYSLGIWKTIRTSVARTSAVMFWMYWPFWRFAASAAAVVAAFCVGEHLWYNNFRLYIEYQRLQAYDNVDAYTVTGNRMQDAGLVVFNETNGVDRARGGCIVNGHTYCIAPILRGGVVKPGEKQSRTSINDLFMAGIDCCSCPDDVITDFRCGDWDDIGSLGGMRLLDEADRKMYRLAVDKWTQNYQKTSVHHIFFTWVNDPIVEWKKLYTRGLQMSILAAIFAIFGSFLLMVVLNGLMKLLREFKIAAPLDDEIPPIPGLGGFGGPEVQTPLRGFMPDEYRHYVSQYDPEGPADPKYVIL